MSDQLPADLEGLDTTAVRKALEQASMNAGPLSGPVMSRLVPRYVLVQPNFQSDGPAMSYSLSASGSRLLEELTSAGD